MNDANRLPFLFVRNVLTLRDYQDIYYGHKFAKYCTFALNLLRSFFRSKIDAQMTKCTKCQVIQPQYQRFLIVRKTIKTVAEFKLNQRSLIVFHLFTESIAIRIFHKCPAKSDAVVQEEENLYFQFHLLVSFAVTNVRLREIFIRKLNSSALFDLAAHVHFLRHIEVILRQVIHNQRQYDMMVLVQQLPSL
ncbi:hypothetical protein T10_7633 [Trichinella papuae]|uniref:Uncharacterized protein n=1 Tax=Trichinella papuae TaxID=268474 RepID=A0A0V1N2D0_9BILA|nr:hypothetical protein T10_7633 [Trichinella papuae]